MTLDESPPPDQPEPERRLPPYGACEHCGQRWSAWTCPCGLHLCDAHRSCPKCDRPR